MLGAARVQILTAYVVEYGAVGLIAGLAGVALGAAAAWPVGVQVFEAKWSVDWTGVTALISQGGPSDRRWRTDRGVAGAFPPPRAGAAQRPSNLAAPCGGAHAGRYLRLRLTSRRDTWIYCSMSDFNPRSSPRRGMPAIADMSVDAGLRAFMLGVYNKVALGLVLSAALAYV